MASQGTRQLGFATSAQMQEFLLTLPSAALILVPHMRLAYQVWRRQRQAARIRGVAAWEPLAMTTLTRWWGQLCRRVWLPLQPASSWQRLVFWQRALEAHPWQGQVLSGISWAALLDETYDLVERYQLPAPARVGPESGLITWRQNLFQDFTAQLQASGVVTWAEIARTLLQALSDDKLALPEALIVVGLETPAPLEEEWLQAVAARRPVTRVHLLGRREEIGQQAVVLPDQHQELEWVAARLLELAQEHPWHRLAITGADLEGYLPALRRILRELIGPATDRDGGYYNFSLGPTLADAPLFQASLLPLRWRQEGEQRQELLAWLQSPFYGAWRGQEKTILRWDLTWRANNLGYGWPRLKQAALEVGTQAEGAELAGRIDAAVELLPAAPVSLSTWQQRLTELWRLLAFPLVQGPGEKDCWQRLQGLLADLAAADDGRPWSAASLLEWLTWGAARQQLAGEGSTEAGLQVHGLLELRGLDYDVVFCLGTNLGQLPPPPRPLPLLTRAERAAVLGGSQESQYAFAEAALRSLQAAAPQLFFTRPQIHQEEVQIASQLVAALVDEEEKRFASLSQPHAGWLRSPAVQAAFRHPQGSPWLPPAEELAIPLPEAVALTAVERALTCPCQFLFADLLALQELPEVEAGLTPLLRGQVLHEVAFLFTSRYGRMLADQGGWQDETAYATLRAVAQEVTAAMQGDPHWQAEVSRWLETEDSLLRRWLVLEKERFAAGWRWLAQEKVFGGLHLPDWPTQVKGRIDRIDHHPDQGLMLWDYKSGELPSRASLQSERRRFQLAGYLAAVQQPCLRLPPHQDLRAGFIGLKSTRSEHLKHEDFKLSAADWQRLLHDKLQEAAEVGRRVGQGTFVPDPHPPPPKRGHACEYCSYGLLCWYTPPAGEEDSA